MTSSIKPILIFRLLGPRTHRSRQAQATAKPECLFLGNTQRTTGSSQPMRHPRAPPLTAQLDGWAGGGGRIRWLQVNAV